MTRNEFMNQLRAKLYKRMSESEINDALAYYEEYFDEAGLAGEQDAIQDLGEPSAIASSIIREHALAEADKQPQSFKKGISAAWVVILSLFALPIAVPVAGLLVFALIALLAGIVLVLFGLLGGIAVVAGAGLVLSIMGIALFAKSFGTGMIFTGVGVSLMGLGLLFIPALIGIANATFRALASLVNSISKWVSKRLNKKDDEPGNTPDDHDSGQSGFREEDFEDYGAPEITPENGSTLAGFMAYAALPQSGGLSAVPAVRCPGLGRRNS